MQIIECKTDRDLLAAYPIMHSHYTDLTKESFLKIVKEMICINFRMIIVEDNGECVAVCGFRVGYRFYCGKFIHMDNMIVREDYRNKGVGRMIVSWICEEGRQLGCDVVLADTYRENDGAQRFFQREGFETRGHHLKMQL